MENLNFDSGIREFNINNNGVLRFNPGDPNVYARFTEAADKFRSVEDTLVSRTKSTDGSGEATLHLLTEADMEAKKILAWVFGDHNDFDKILGGVNLLAVGTNGERVITNLLNALLPIIKKGAEDCAKQQTDAVRAQAKAERDKRGG